MLDFLKSFCSLYTLYKLWFVVSIIWFLLALRKKKKKFSTRTLSDSLHQMPLSFKLNLLFAFLFYLVCATSYIPEKLIYNKESTFKVFSSTSIDSTQTYYIHVLGAGYSLDSNLHATQKLGLSSLGRLTEAVRIYHKHSNIRIVTSAYSKYGMESQASITKKAAIELGVKPEHIFMLEEPSTTSEEVKAFISRFGTEVQLIVSSDAMHLPRAIQMFKDNGIEAIPAPTNFKVKVDENHPIEFTLPKSKSFGLANDYFVTLMKEYYYKISGK
jgi:uncharacterized SAM-binding protein YcdF (DUF218 family)